MAYVTYGIPLFVCWTHLMVKPAGSFLGLHLASIVKFGIAELWMLTLSCSSKWKNASWSLASSPTDWYKGFISIQHFKIVLPRPLVGSLLPQLAIVRVMTQSHPHHKAREFMGARPFTVRQLNTVCFLSSGILYILLFFHMEPFSLML